MTTPWRGSLATTALSLVCLNGCSSSNDSTFNNAAATADAGKDSTTPWPDGSYFGDSGGCRGFECLQVSCDGGATTTLSGKVWDPGGINPLYNAIVYVPNGVDPVEPFPVGVSCDTCATRTTGSPVVATVTDYEGKFVLANIPIIAAGLPLVIQVGKWRRQVTIPNVRSCTSNDITTTQKDLTRLPKNQSEGDIPRIAIATGNADPFECLLKKIGIATTEFTIPSGTGRIHYYQAAGGTTLTRTSTPPGEDLWEPAAPHLGGIDKLKTYDIVLLPCEGAEHRENKLATGRDAVVKYANAGGRVFVTHYGYEWLAHSASGSTSTPPWVSTGTWHDPIDTPDGTVSEKDLRATIDRTFPKGIAFAQWLGGVGALTTTGHLLIDEARNNLDATTTTTSRTWIRAPNNQSKQVVMHMTFNTPIGVPETTQCGKVVYSDFHVTTNALDSSQPYFPDRCRNDPMSPQEKALEFMLFDLSACVQNDADPPVPPR